MERIEVRPSIYFVLNATYHDFNEEKSENNHQVNVRDFHYQTTEDVLWWHNKVNETIKEKHC